MKGIKSNLIIIVLIGLLIFLGVLWLYKKNKIREGINDKPAALLELGNKVETEIVDITGIPVPSGEEVVDLFKEVLNIGTNEIEAADKRAADRAEADANTPVVNTVKPTFMPLTFFAGNKFGDAFCQLYSGDYPNLSNQCSALTSESCNATNCCVWVNGKQCMAGNKDGPTVPMGSSATVDADYYSYKYQCYGKCNSPTIVPPSSTTLSYAAGIADIGATGIAGTAAGIAGTGIAGAGIAGTGTGAAGTGAAGIAGTGTGAAGTGTGDCMTDDTSTNVTPACVNKAWSQVGCQDSWIQIPMNKGWFNLPGSLLNVDTTDKNLYYKDKSTHVANITGQTMAKVQGHMAALAQYNPSACVPPPSMSNTDIALSMLFR